MSTSRPTEEFYFTRSIAVMFGLLGLGILSFVGMLLLDPAFRRPSDPVLFGMDLAMVAAGLALCWAAIKRATTRIYIGGAGIRFPGAELPIPWGMMAGFRSRPLGGGVEILDRGGEVLGIVPTDLDEFERAVLLVAEGIPLGVTARTGAPLTGSRGWLATLGLLAAVAISLLKLDLDQVQNRSPVPLVVALLVFGVGCWKYFAGWRKTGSFEVGIDAEGVRYRGRGRSWETKWGEVRKLVPHLGAREQFNGGRIEVVLLNGISHEIPLAGIDVHRVLHELRAHGGSAAAALTPSEERPALPLLQRSF